MTIKVAFNACHGGFELSEAAEAEYERITGQKWSDNTPRHDAALIEVIERLGEKASGYVADLQVMEISSDRYVIRELDGLENVVTPDDIRWSEP